MKRLHWLGALTATAMLFSAAASADDHRDRRNWDRNDHHSDRWNRGHDGRRWDRRDHWRGHDGRWDNRRYHHNRYGAPGHRYNWNGNGRGSWGSRYYGGPYYRGRDYYYYPHYRRSSLDATVVLSIPL